VPQHFNVEGPYQVLADLLVGEVLFGEALLDPGELLEDDAVLFLLGLGLSDALDERLQFLGEVGCRGHERLLILIIW
jgi:hypothetical protein